MHDHLGISVPLHGEISLLMSERWLMTEDALDKTQTWFSLINHSFFEGNMIFLNEGHTLNQDRHRDSSFVALSGARVSMLVEDISSVERLWKLPRICVKPSNILCKFVFNLAEIEAGKNYIRCLNSKNEECVVRQISLSVPPSPKKKWRYREVA